MDSYKVIAEYLDDHTTILQQLMIEGNQTGDKPVILICKALQYNNNLKFLNISRNNITDTSAIEVAKMLVMNNKLNVLFMHWNKVRETGGNKIAKAFLKNDSLQIFDISYNNIGTMGKERSAAKALSDGFKDNKALLHVDISNCNFDGEDIEIINKGLTDNHTILGIHLLGNMGTTDTLGYVHKSEQIDCAMCNIFTRIKPTLERGVKRNSQAISLHAASNCWICEGWTEVKFELIPDEVFPEKHDPYVPIYLHISSDKFEQDLLLPDEENPGVYYSTRMVPPGDISYYFSKESMNYVAHNKPLGSVYII